MLQQSIRTAPERERSTPACQHHWIIEAPAGPVSQGRCRVCGEVRQFKNYIESAPWGDESPTAATTPQPQRAPAEETEEPEEY